MTLLRDRMAEDLRIRNYSPRTVECYVSMMGRFAREFDKPPGQLGPEEIRTFQVRMIEQRVSWTTFNQSVCALRFFYSVTLPRDFAVEHIPFAKTKRKLPTVLSVDEVRRLLGTLTNIARYTHRVAIGNRRILEVGEAGVKFRCRDRGNGQRTRAVILPGVEFLRRFLLHVLPRGFPRIRHFGLLANRRRAVKLATCRLLLAAPMPAPAMAGVAPTVVASDRCPACRAGRLVWTEFRAVPREPLVIDSS